jgi:hypothetical protein
MSLSYRCRMHAFKSKLQKTKTKKKISKNKEGKKEERHTCEDQTIILRVFARCVISFMKR